MQPVLLNWPASNLYGWGVVGLNIFFEWANDAEIRALMGAPFTQQELAGTDPLRLLSGKEAIIASNRFQHEVLRARAGMRLSLPVIEALGNGFKTPHGVTGTRTFGRCIFEDTRVAGHDTDFSHYDMLICASAWNAALLRAHSTKRVEIVPEGIDPSQFHPGPKSGALDPGRFYIFSGGKVEYRKGHDLTLLAFREFLRRHDDAVLVTLWHSPWPQLSAGFKGRLDVALGLNAQGAIDSARWLTANGIDPAKVIEIGQVANPMMPGILREMDCALQPSRAEACTNLLAKEAMACGIPVILAGNTGVLDLIDGENCLALTRQTPISDFPQCGTEGWGESDIEEILAALETLYADSARRRTIGKNGADWIVAQGRTWSNHARALKSLILSA